MWLMLLVGGCSPEGGSGVGPAWTGTASERPEGPGDMLGADPGAPDAMKSRRSPIDLAFLECDARDWLIVVESAGEVARGEVVVVATEAPASGARLPLTLKETGSTLWTRLEARWEEGRECTRHANLFVATTYDADGEIVGCRWWGSDLEAFTRGELDERLDEQLEWLNEARSVCRPPTLPPR